MIPLFAISDENQAPDRMAAQMPRPCRPGGSFLNSDLPSANHHRLCLSLLVLAWGVQAIVTQSLLLREALVLMFGSEFAWGIVLFAWLLGVAIGAAFGGRLAARMARPDVLLLLVLVGLSLATCAELWVFRSARAWLGVRPGELLPLPITALAAMIFVPPVGALVGVAFPLACSIRNTVPGVDGKPRTGWSAVLQFGQVYALESAGSLIGGAAFSFWAVDHLTPIQTALVSGAIATAAAAFFAVAARRRYGTACLGPLAAAMLLTAIFAGDSLNRRLVERRWRSIAPGYELCAETESRYQNLAIGRREKQYTLYCNGHIAADFPDPYSYVPLAHFWMCQHPLPRRVLVLGGGAEGLLVEILRHPIEHVDYVEPDPRQIELISPYLTDADRAALNDRRVTVHYVDARYFIKTQRDRFDLVIARLPEPTSALRARFYTDEFYRELRRAMTPRSVLCTTAAASPGELSTASAEYLASIRAAIRRHFPKVIVSWGDPAHVLAATADGLITIDPAELVRRYTDRGVRSAAFNPLWFDSATDALDPDKVAQRERELDAATGVQTSTDMRPSVYMQRLVLWERMTGGETGRFVGRLRAVGWSEMIAALAGIGVLTLLVCRFHARAKAASSEAPAGAWASGAVVLSVGTTGFATMALSLIWLFAFQNLYGYVYQRIGWIIALFMGGLVIGCWLPARSSRAAPVRRLWSRLIAVDVLIALLALAVPFVLPALDRVQGTQLAFTLVEVAISALVALTGVLCGAAFALAGAVRLAAADKGSVPDESSGGDSLRAADSDAGAVAGTVVGADHAGACLGALATGILLVPVFGTAGAAFLLAAIKLCSAVVLLLARRREPAAAHQNCQSPDRTT
jgi:spermidine synthase